MPSLAAIVLAAGEGRRMGGPKALLAVNGEPLVSQHVRRLQEAGCDLVVVVVRSDTESAVRAWCAAWSSVSVVAAETTAPSESLGVGARSLGRLSDRNVFVTPVDLLPPQPATLAALWAALRDETVAAATPRFRGRGGHPVLLRRRVLCDFVDRGHGSLRDLLHALGPARRVVEVDDEAVIGDFDRPVDLLPFAERR